MSVLKQQLILSYVPRWVVVPMLREQTVSDHSWRVAMIAVVLAGRIGMTAEQVNAIAFMAMGHDLEEATTGDIPSTQKEVPDFGGMTTEDLTVKIADYLEQKVWVWMWAHPTAKDEVMRHLSPKLKEAVDVLAYRYQEAKEAVSGMLTELTT